MDIEKLPSNTILGAGALSSSIESPRKIMDYMATPIFVQSLVSPHGNITRPIKTTNDDKVLKRKRKHAKNSKRNATSIKKDHLALGECLVIEAVKDSITWPFCNINNQEDEELPLELTIRLLKESKLQNRNKPMTCYNRDRSQEKDYTPIP
ncbi:hypothetical protein Tco_0128894 [Tanacetum coccineum]